MGLPRQNAVQDRLRLQVGNRRHVLPVGEDAETLFIPDDAEVDGHLLHHVVQVLDDEQAGADVRQVFAKFLGATALRLVKGEVGLQEAHLQQTAVLLRHHAAVGGGQLRPSQQRGKRASLRQRCRNYPKVVFNMLFYRHFFLKGGCSPPRSSQSRAYPLTVG